DNCPLQLAVEEDLFQRDVVTLFSAAPDCKLDAANQVHSRQRRAPASATEVALVRAKPLKAHRLRKTLCHRRSEHACGQAIQFAVHRFPHGWRSDCANLIANVYSV